MRLKRFGWKAAITRRHRRRCRGSGDDGRDLGGQVGVVVDERGPAVDAADVEAADDAAEPGQRRGARLERHAERDGHGDGAEGVDDVVHAAQRQRDDAERHRSVGGRPLDRERERPAVHRQVDGAEVGALGEAVRHGAVAYGHVGAQGVVDAEHRGSGDLAEVALEAVDQRLERPVVLEEVELDVGEDRRRERQREVRAVALVGLDDEPVAPAQWAPVPASATSPPMRSSG